ncbi:poly(A) polymerase type 3-like [Periophthalmus magnuspinnatus]|uniref:poly(A) polymerase type 3-like n=1 Tax=Periophthalmus magnuspinnatus TaxID=409849 RepID=UPI00145B591E|nr:poly(A) polymerase type 3-like [Periophthalmus magnuspinnatus]
MTTGDDTSKSQSLPVEPLSPHSLSLHLSLLFEISSLEDVPKWYGITEPASFDLPSEEELRRTRMLMEDLKSIDIFQSHLEVKRRERMVQNLESLFKKWLTETCLEMNVPDHVTEQVGGRVVPFGSYALGINTKGNDIDLLCVGPGFVERSQFFSSFVEKLKTHSGIQIIQVVEDAFVPIIKLTYYGTDIDMVYAKINRNSISNKLNLMDVAHLKDMEIHCVRSLQGYRITQEIMSLVPNIFTFREVLVTIKHWAKCRNIYSNKMGFLGGVSWGILVARVCQLYPYATTATLVAKFFKVVSMWDWTYPILLKFPEEHKLNLPVWNPRVNVSDRFHHMPIITPSYPHQNSAFNVSSSTLKIMMEEIKRGHTIMEMKDSKAAWKKLFEPAEFLQDYKYYIVLRANAATEAQHQVWAGFVESKIRHLVGTLEKNFHVALACPSLESFPGKDCLNTTWLVGVKFYSTAKNVNLSQNVERYIHNVYAHSGKLWAEGMELSAAYADQETVKSKLPAEDTRAAVQPRGQAKKRGHSPDNSESVKKLKEESTGIKADANVHGKDQTSTKRPYSPESNPAAKRAKKESSPVGQAIGVRHKPIKRPKFIFNKTT